MTDILRRTNVSDVFGSWSELKPFLFANGSPNPPELLRDIPEQNYLDTGVRIFGLTLMSIALFTIVVSVIFVYACRKSRVVKASQPVFLYLLAFGSLLQTLSIVLLSYDESYGWTAEMLGKACTAMPWLLMMGHIFNYSALFSKVKFSCCHSLMLGFLNVNFCCS